MHARARREWHLTEEQTTERGTILSARFILSSQNFCFAFDETRPVPTNFTVNTGFIFFLRKSIGKKKKKHIRNFEYPRLRFYLIGFFALNSVHFGHIRLVNSSPSRAEIIGPRLCILLKLWPNSSPTLIKQNKKKELGFGKISGHIGPHVGMRVVL